MCIAAQGLQCFHHATFKKGNVETNLIFHGYITVLQKIIADWCQEIVFTTSYSIQNTFYIK